MPDKDIVKLRNDLLKRLDGYSREVRAIFYNIIDDIVNIISKTKYVYNPERLFSFSNHPEISKQINDKLRELYSSLYAVLRKDIEKEWNEANKKSDELIKDVFGVTAANKSYSSLFNSNTESLDKFFQRKQPDGPLNLSRRIWKIEGQFRQEMEIAIDTSISNGISADNMSKKIRQYLQEPDKLFRRVRNERGELVLSKVAKAYHPGQGMYRSSYKNAMRVTRTAPNAAYRSSDYERWQQLPFVIGYEVKRSNNPYDCDICESLKGIYPKTFKWTGWHPQCRCYAVPILLPEDERSKMRKLIAKGEDVSHITNKYAIKDYPKGFNEWMKKNADRIDKANNRGTLPQWVKNNAKQLNVDVKDINSQSVKYDFISVSKQRYNSYDNGIWSKEYFDEHSGGFNVYHKQHQFTKTGGGGNAEKTVGHMLAKYNGKQVEFLSEAGDGKKSDINFDNQTWDIKYINNSQVRTIRKHLLDAGKADNAIFYWEKDNIGNFREAISREVGRMNKLGRIAELPDVYYMDNGILKLFWKK